MSERDDEEEEIGAGIRFEMYSPEEEDLPQMRSHVPFAVHNTQHKKTSAEKKQEEEFSIWGMKDYIVNKKNDFFEKLDDMQKNQLL